MSLGITKGGTTKCGSTKCKCCEAVPQTPVPKVIINDRAISLLVVTANQRTLYI